MKIKSIFAITIAAAALTLTSCETMDNLKNLFSGDESNNNSQTANSTIAKEPRYTKDKIDETVWDLSKLDTARNVDYMYEVEKNVILEMNMARSNPKKYAELYIEPRTKRFSGNIYNGKLMTQEGAAVVKECVSFMNTQRALPVLKPSKGLTQAAKDHSSTQSLTNQVGHAGTDGSDPFERMQRYGSFMTAGENIDYGCSSAREIVVSLLVDDGVKSRGHRKNIMNKSFTTAGVGYADKHKAFNYMCVIDYSGEYKETE